MLIKIPSQHRTSLKTKLEFIITVQKFHSNSKGKILEDQFTDNINRPQPNTTWLQYDTNDVPKLIRPPIRRR